MFEVDAILGPCGALTAAGRSQTHPQHDSTCQRCKFFSETQVQPRIQVHQRLLSTLRLRSFLSFRIYRCPSSTFLRLFPNLQIWICGESQSKADQVSARKSAGTDEGINLINLGRGGGPISDRQMDGRVPLNDLLEAHSGVRNDM